jgi:hypothetical protein
MLRSLLSCIHHYWWVCPANQTCCKIRWAKLELDLTAPRRCFPSCVQSDLWWEAQRLAALLLSLVVSDLGRICGHLRRSSNIRADCRPGMQSLSTSVLINVVWHTFIEPKSRWSVDNLFVRTSISSSAALFADIMLSSLALSAAFHAKFSNSSPSARFSVASFAEISPWTNAANSSAARFLAKSGTKLVTWCSLC